jgi:nucleoside-diphosphate-sugar epimerase|tara:strand:- start:158 stop:1066 length:909 start_codon:yes stop_codon:yes gene_type:complete
LKKKILIVGGTGFVGSELAKKCLTLNWEVTSISTSNPIKKKKLNKVKYIICDISKKKNLYLKIKYNFNYVVNLGGYVDHKNKIKTYNSHYLGCKNLADFFLDKKITSFIQMGSSLEYGRSKSPHFEEIKTDYRKLKSVYAKSKLLATNYLLKLNKDQDFPCTILRLYLTYGPTQDYNRFIPIIIKACLKNSFFDCSDGKQSRDFLYIDDLIKLIIRALKNKNAIGQIINAGSGNKYNLKKVIKKIINKSNGGVANYGKIKLRKDEIISFYPSISKAKKILDWKPKVNLEKGLKRTINYYKSL